MTASISKLSSTQVRDWFSNLPKQDFASQRILLIVPKVEPRTTLPSLFGPLFHEIRPLCLTFDVMIALGSQPPMSDSQIARLLGIRDVERGRLFFQTHFFNHEFDRPDRLMTIGMLTTSESADAAGNSLTREIPVQINSRIRDYDLLLVLSPSAQPRPQGFPEETLASFLVWPEVKCWTNWLA